MTWAYNSDENEEAGIKTLLELSMMEDPEVSTQAIIRMAQVQARSNPAKALELLNGKSAKGLGPAWDASLEEVRAEAHSMSGNHNEAKKTLMALADRWPDDEEAELPAWLGLADLHRAIGEKDEALSWAKMAKAKAKDPNYRDRAITFIKGIGN